MQRSRSDEFNETVEKLLMQKNVGQSKAVENFPRPVDSIAWLSDSEFIFCWPTLVFITRDIFYLSVLNAVLAGLLISQPVF